MHFGVPAGGDGVPQPAVARSPVPRVLCAERWAAAAALPLETQPACAGHVQALRLGEGRLGHHQGERRGGGGVSGMGFPACIRRDAACACRIDSGSASLHACRRRCWVRAGEQSPHYLGGIWEGGAFVEINVCSLPRAAWSITPGPGWRTARAASLLVWRMRRRAGTPSACTRRR